MNLLLAGFGHFYAERIALVHHGQPGRQQPEAACRGVELAGDLAGEEECLVGRAQLQLGRTFHEQAGTGK